MSDVLLTKEFWTALVSISTILLTALVKMYKEIKKVVDKNAEETNKQMRKTVDRSVSDYISVRAKQISFAEDCLEEYAVFVTQTSDQAALSFVCKSDCDTVRIISELWQTCCKKTITKDVLGHIIKLINKNGFREVTNYEKFITDETRDSFNCFIGAMKKEFRAQEIRVRVDWIEANMDKDFMRQTIAKILYECRDLSNKFHDDRG